MSMPEEPDLPREAEQPEIGSGPPGPDEMQALEAELRSAVQLQRAEYERIRERQRELEATVERARQALERLRELRDGISEPEKG